VSDTGPEAADLEREARATIEAYRAYLNSPAFQHSIDLAVLVKIAGDDNQPIRERRRAAEVLAKLRLEAMDALATLTGTREQSLDVLGIKQGPQSLALTQVNQKIEIVRAKDWRAAPAIADGAVVDVETLPAGDAAAADHATESQPAVEEDGDGADPPS
jgi:hypothetical protein